MREKWPKQMPLMPHILDHAKSRELEVISSIIDANPTICEHILQDLNRGKSKSQRAGAKAYFQHPIWGKGNKLISMVNQTVNSYK